MPLLSTEVTEARFALSGKAFVVYSSVFLSADGLDKTLPAIFTSLGGILSLLTAFVYLNLFD